MQGHKAKAMVQEGKKNRPAVQLSIFLLARVWERGSLTCWRQECNGKHGFRGNLTVFVSIFKGMSTARNLFHRCLYPNPAEI